MKLLVVTLICLNFLQVLCRNIELERKLMKSLLTECQKEEGGTDDEVAKLMQIEFPDTREAKCMIACSYHKVGIYDNGKFSRDTFLYIAGMVVDNDPVKMIFAGETADKCGVAEGERCEQAFTFTKCLHEAVVLTKIDIDLI